MWYNLIEVIEMSVVLDYLPNHSDLKIYQDDSMFRINSDTYALGEFIEVYKNDTVLDVGTNNGALLIYASLFHPKKMIGIDINSKAIELAKKNMELNNIDNCTLINQDFLDYSGEEVDVIICNPPYFKGEMDKSDNEFKALAKHDNYLPIDKLMAGIRKNLKNYGTLFFLYQTSRLDEVVMEMNKNHLTIKEIKFVYDVNKDYSNVFMIKACKGLKKGLNVLKPLIIDRKF